MYSQARPLDREVTRTMQYMGAHNGGLPIDFKPIVRYDAIASEDTFHPRVETVIDWMAVAVELGLLDGHSFHALFVRQGDFLRFARELRQYDLPVKMHHVPAGQRLGLVRHGHAFAHADLADPIERRLMRLGVA